MDTRFTRLRLARAIGVVAVILMALVLEVCGADSHSPQAVLGGAIMEVLPASDHVVGPYAITNRESDGRWRVEVRCRGRLLQTIPDSQLVDIGFRTNVEVTEVQCSLADLNQDGQPELVIQTAPPTARGTQLWVFTTNGCAATTGIGDAAPLLRDPRTNGCYALYIAEPAFGSWQSDAAHALAPQVILAWRKGRMEPSAELMQVPRPTPAELKRLLPGGADGEARTNEEGTRLQVLRAALDLMYGGQEAAGWELIRMAQSRGVQMSREVVKELRQLRDASPYWQALVKSRRAAGKSASSKTKS